jgi:hypothetical protein
VGTVPQTNAPQMDSGGQWKPQDPQFLNVSSNCQCKQMTDNAHKYFISKTQDAILIYPRKDAIL